MHHATFYFSEVRLLKESKAMALIQYQTSRVTEARELKTD